MTHEDCQTYYFRGPAEEHNVSTYLSIINHYPEVFDKMKVRNYKNPWHYQGVFPTPRGERFFVNAWPHKCRMQIDGQKSKEGSEGVKACCDLIEELRLGTKELCDI